MDGSNKYARIEIERKYLLHALPPGLDPSGPHWLITDAYFTGTRLRLRRMVHSQTGQVICKLGQKYRGAGQDSIQTTLTNLYLDEAEYARLLPLQYPQVSKRRYAYEWEGRRYSIDVFEGRLAGLVLAEIECKTVEEAGSLPFPAFAAEDVTGNPRYEGGVLAYTLTG